jgi:predicted dehydrogenase
MNGKSGLTRREFVGAAAGAAAITFVPARVLGKDAPSDLVNIAVVGSGGHGAFVVTQMLRAGGINVVALCDVDSWSANHIETKEYGSRKITGLFKQFPKLPKYKDFRVMLTKEQKNIDAVVITTPEHIHISAAAMAMKMGKHVYCSKLLGHNIHEIRLATQLAEEYGVITQMGIGNHTTEIFHRAVEIIQAGDIGEVKDAFVWCDNEWDKYQGPKAWPPRAARDYNPKHADRQLREKKPVPDHLDWDLWLGPRQPHPYPGTGRGLYHPSNWRSWWAFGNGRIGDIGSHAVDLVFWALGLKYPLTAECEGPGRAGLERVPPWQKATWTFPARGKKPPVTVKWAHGNKRFDELKGLDLPHEWPVGIHFVGSDGRLTMQIERGPAGPMELYPKAKYAKYKPPRRTLPRSHGGEYRQWIQAVRNNKQSLAEMPFSYSGPLCETLALGNVAYRTGKKLQWDPAQMKAINAPEADKFIQGSYRKGWELDKPKILKRTPSKKPDRPAEIRKPAPPVSKLEKLLIRIEKTDLPKAYDIRKHQEYVDRRLAGLSNAKKARISGLWADKRRVHPKMANKGKSFVRIMEYVARNEK